MDELYQERILEYARNPKKKGIFEGCNCSGDGKNPSCGDRGKFFCIYDKNSNILTKVSYDGEGCAISQSGMSMLAEMLEGQSLNYAESLLPKDIYDMFGVRIGPARALCAMLCYNAMQQMIKCIKEKDI